MNKLVTLLIIFQIMIFRSFSNDLEIMPVKINFHGAVSSGTNLIGYGDFGTILLSTNRGRSWEQKTITPNGDIRQMLDINDTLWAMTDNGYILLSYDNGLNWKNNKLENEFDDKFYNFCVNKNSIYIRTKNKVLRFDKKFNFLDEYTDSLLNYENNDWPYSITTYHAYRLIETSGNKIILSVNTDNTGKLLVLSENLKKIRVVELNQYIGHKEWLYECREKFLYKDREVWQIGTRLYYSNDDFTEWTYIFPDSTIGDYFSDRSLNSFTFNIIDDNIYVSYKEPSVIVKRGTGTSIQNYNIGIKKYNETNNSFENIGGMFENDYYTIYPVTDQQDGISGVCSINKLLVHEDSVFVLVGANKTLLQSTDKGKNWELISYLSGTPRLTIKDSDIYYINSGYLKNELNISHDKGQTFQPAKYKFVSSTGYLQTFSSILSFYLDVSGYGFVLGNNKRNSSKNIMKTSDGAKSFEFLSDDGPYVFEDNMENTNICHLQDKYIFALTYHYMDYDRYYNYLFQIDSGNNTIKNITIDSNNIFRYIIGESPERYQALVSTNLDEDYDNRNFEIWETIDSGKTFTSIHSMKQDFEIHDIFRHNSDTIFISTLNENNVFLYDRTRKKFELIFSDNSKIYNNLQLITIGNKFYILGDGIFLENTDKNDLTQWKTIEWNYGKPHFYSVISGKNIFIAEFEDDLYDKNYYLFKMKESTDAPAVEIRYETHFYAQPSYPNPVKDIVRSKVYWDLNFEPEESIVGVYNIFGELVDKKEKVFVSNICINSAILEWDSTGNGNGIYFIIVKYHGKMMSIPVVVIR